MPMGVPKKIKSPSVQLHVGPGDALAGRGLGEAMVGISVDEIPEPHRLETRGW